MFVVAVLGLVCVPDYCGSESLSLVGCRGLPTGVRLHLPMLGVGKGLSRLLLGVNAVHDHYSFATQLSVWLLARVRLTV